MKHECPACGLSIVLARVFLPFARDLWLALDLHFRPGEVREAGDQLAPPLQRR